MRDNIQLIFGDCLEKMEDIPEKSVDMIFTDLPYGSTSCKWDIIIPFESLWEQYKRIIKSNRAIVLFGTEPFSSYLRMSNINWFKYDWIWDKSRALGFTNAKNKPMNKHELISIFSEGTVANKSKCRMLYNPQGLLSFGKIVSGIKACKADNEGHKFGRPAHKKSYVQEFTNYPTQIIKFDNDGNTKHPTQKPILLCEYLIKTYSNEGDIILDSCMGSGTAGIACLETNRRFIGIEKNENIFNTAKERIEDYILKKENSLV